MRALAPGIATGGTTNVGWALGASLGVHALALAAIVWGWGSPSVPHGALLMDVELVEVAALAPGPGPGDPAPSTAGEPAPPVAQPPTPAADVAIVLPAPEAIPPMQADEWRAQPAVPVEPPAVAPPTPPTPTAVKPSPPPAATTPPPRPTPSPRPPTAAAAPSSGSGPDASAMPSGVPSGTAQLLRHVPPQYPALARERGQEGRVVVRLVIGADGVPAEVRVAESSGVAALDTAALEAVRQWRFAPARRSGVAVAEERLAPVVFRLRH